MVMNRLDEMAAAQMRRRAAAILGRKGGRKKGPTKARPGKAISYANAVRWTKERELMTKVEIWRDEDKEWHWKIIGTSEVWPGYPSKAEAWADAKSKLTGKECRKIGRPKVVREEVPQ